MSEESFNRSDSICYICKSPIFPHEDAFFHGAPFHGKCLNNTGNGLIATLEPDPVPVFMWIKENWILGNVEFVVLKGRLSFCLNRDWQLDPLVKVLDDFENPSGVAYEAEIPEVIVISSDTEVETIESF